MIETKNLYFKYDNGYEALKNINMEIRKGQIIGLIGENGSGKSTLFLSILGINKKSSGDILIDGQSISYKKSFIRQYRKKVNMVLQDPDKQIFYSDVYSDMAFGLRNLKLTEDEIEKRITLSLEALEISDLRDKAVHYLSYGQKKRLAIAGVLAMDPEFILLDEPTAGLDPRLTRQMIKTIKKLKDNDKTILVSSHDMDFIYEVCDYIYVINKGEIISQGKTSEVFLDKDKIRGAGLDLPTLARLHANTGLPLFENEDELYSYLNKKEK